MPQKSMQCFDICLATFSYLNLFILNGNISLTKERPWKCCGKAIQWYLLTTNGTRDLHIYKQTNNCTGHSFSFILISLWIRAFIYLQMHVWPAVLLNILLEITNLFVFIQKHKGFSDTGLGLKTALLFKIYDSAWILLKFGCDL